VQALRWANESWKLRQADQEEGARAEDLAAAERDELKRLRKENRQLRIDALAVARLARTLVDRCRELTAQIKELEAELETLVDALAPALTAIRGCGTLTAAKILGETADVRRFRSRHAYARHNGTAPLPVWSGNRSRHRLSRTGNRQLNAAIHRIAITQAHYHQPARDLLERRCSTGDTVPESIRVLKRRLSDVAYRALLTDAPQPDTPHLTAAA
jgi:transposase